VSRSCVNPNRWPPVLLGDHLTPLPPPPPPPPPFPDIDVFRALVFSATRTVKAPPSKFVKQLDEIPQVPVHADSSRSLALKLADRGLIGQFTGIYPSPRAVSAWVDKNWCPLIQRRVSTSFCGGQKLVPAHPTKGFFFLMR
jgi:hypothetical protein